MLDRQIGSIPTSIEAITVIIVIFIPDYVFLQFTRGAVAFVPQSVDARYFFAVITWGGIIHIGAFRWTRNVLDWYIEDTLANHETYALVGAAFVLLIAPLVVGIAASWLIQLSWVDRQLGRIGMDYVRRTPSAWSYAMKLGSRWVRVYLKDGTMIGGIYGGNSFADDEDQQDIYLEQVYNLTSDGDFKDPIENNAGIWISHDAISYVVFFRVDQSEVIPNGEQETSDRSTTAAGLGEQGNPTEG